MLDQLGCAPTWWCCPWAAAALHRASPAIFAGCAPKRSSHSPNPKAAPAWQAALQTGKPVALNAVDSFVDGAAVAKLGALPFEHLSHFSSDQVFLAPEDRICGTMLEMLNAEGIVLEPAGALALDVLADMGDLTDKTVVVVCSGGNFDFERLPEVKERAQRFSGLKKYFVLRMPQRPGALRDLLQLLGPDDDIARFEYLKKSARNFGSVLIGIETTAPANLTSLMERLTEGGFNFRDITNDGILSELLV